MAQYFALNGPANTSTAHTTIRRPQEFCYFSFDEEHRLKPLSSSSLRYYYPPFFQAPGVDTGSISLSKGFDSWIRSESTEDPHLDAILTTLQAHEERLIEQGVSKFGDVCTRADFVAFRGMMTEILIAPFDKFSEFSMNATCFQDTIFIEDNFPNTLRRKAQEKQDEIHRPKPPEDPPHEMMTFWGYKFEAIATLAKPFSESTREEIEARDAEIVNNNPQYCSVVKTGIGSSSLVIAGEVDCVMGGKPKNPQEPIPWVELKTTFDADRSKQRELQKFERKLLKYWAQSFLLGVPYIMVGHRSRDGHLTHILELETKTLPTWVKRGTNVWDGNVCISTAAAFLQFLKQTISGQDGVWRIVRTRDNPYIKVYKVEESGAGEIVSEEFKAHRMRLRQKLE